MNYFVQILLWILLFTRFLSERSGAGNIASKGNIETNIGRYWPEGAYQIA